MAKPSGSSLWMYVLRRLMLMVPTLIGITVVVFTISQMVPGGPIHQAIMASQGGGVAGEGGASGASQGTSTGLTEKQLAVLKEFYGFGDPPVKRYLKWLKRTAMLDFGNSQRYLKPVTELIAERLPVSIYYGLITTALTYLICIPLGIVKALKHRTLIDNSTSVLIFTGYSVPGYALGALLITLFAVNRDWFPVGGFRSENWDTLSTWQKVKDQVHHSVLPLVCYMIGSFATMTIMMKNSLMENMSADYVKTALAKGLGWRQAIFGHALRNSLIPLAATFGNNISLVLTGSLLIERMFNIPGMGRLFFEGIQSRDYTLVMGTTVITAVLSMVGNLLSDLCVAAVDPRVRFG
jgi:microcin C transport system permease protein